MLPSFVSFRYRFGTAMTLTPAPVRTSVEAR